MRTGDRDRGGVEAMGKREGRKRTGKVGGMKANEVE